MILDQAPKGVLVAAASGSEQLSILDRARRGDGQLTGPKGKGMRAARVHPVVHLELHTGNLPRACAFYTQLFGWRVETVHVGCGSYLALELGDGIEGGVVECDTERSQWLPYVEVTDLEGERVSRRGRGDDEEEGRGERFRSTRRHPPRGRVTNVPQ